MGKRAEVRGPVAPIRQLTLKEMKIVGAYEFKSDTDTYRLVFLDNFKSEHYVNRQKPSIGNWSIVGKEVHVVMSNESLQSYRLNPDNSITQIASIRGYMNNGMRDEYRIDFPNFRQHTFKKIN